MFLKKEIRGIVLICIGIFCLCAFLLIFSCNPDVAQTDSQLFVSAVHSSALSAPEINETANKSDIESAETNDRISESSQTLVIQETTTNSPASDAMEPASDTQTSNVPEGKIVYANLKYIQKPQEADFGAWCDYALDIYNQYVTGTFQESQNYLFPYDAEVHPWDKMVKHFFDTFQEKCLTGLDIDVAYHQYLDNTNGETRIRIQLDQSSINQYQDIVYAQNTIQFIVGDAVSERTVIDRITDWCIQNCQYDNDYKFNGEYRDVNTVVKNLLQTQKGICDDFAQLVSYTCDLYGIPCEYITPSSDGRSAAERHAWNRVCLSGTWYYIDVAWSVCSGYNAYPPTDTLWADHEPYL